MKIIDTHIHWYAEEFDEDRRDAIGKAIEAGVEEFLLPAIDSSYEEGMKELVRDYPGRMHMMGGLHPTHVKENYLEELGWVEQFLDRNECKAVGEIGMDLYWDKTYFSEQQRAFQTQIQWSLERKLPIAIHCRDAFEPIFAILEDFRGSGLRGVFHCFTGDKRQAEHALELGFHLGIGGVVTYKNSGLSEVLPAVPLNRIVLETDAPYLAPVPFRGKRNEGAHIRYVLERVAQIYGLSENEVAERCRANSIELFDL